MHIFFYLFLHPENNYHSHPRIILSILLITQRNTLLSILPHLFPVKIPYQNSSLKYISRVKKTQLRNHKNKSGGGGK